MQLLLSPVLGTPQYMIFFFSLMKKCVGFCLRWRNIRWLRPYKNLLLFEHVARNFFILSSCCGDIWPIWNRWMQRYQRLSFPRGGRGRKKPRTLRRNIDEVKTSLRRPARSFLTLKIERRCTYSFCHFQGPKRFNSALALNGLRGLSRLFLKFLKFQKCSVPLE